MSVVASKIYASRLIAKAISAQYVGYGSPAEDIAAMQQALFGQTEQGALYDLYDAGTIFQDAAGTTPWTTLGQPVGLILDKRLGLALGAESVTNGSFTSGTAGWANNGGLATTFEAVSHDGESTSLHVIGPLNSGAVQSPLTSNKVYAVTYRIKVISGSVYVGISANPVGGVHTTADASIWKTVTRAVYGATDPAVRIYANSAGTEFYVTGVSFKELPGNHAYQTTLTARPTIEARVNLFTKSEQFDDVAWTRGAVTISANSTTAPDGTLTADLFTESTANSSHYILQTAASGTGRAAMTFHVKPNGRTRVKIRSEQPQTVGLSTTFNLTGSGSVVAGTGTITALANGWYRCTATSIGNGNGASGYHLIQTLGPADADVYTGDGVSGIYVWGAQLETGTAFTTYQRVNTATDYADIGAPRRLKFDGIDDFLVTNSINFTGTDKMTVWAGVRKLSDAALSCLVELSATAATNNGSFVIYAPRAAGNYASSLRGTTVAGLVVATYAAPISNVLSFKYDIGATGYLAEIVPRVNAATPTITNIDGADAGSGNFGNYPLYIGRRGGTTLPFNGELYSPIVIRGAQSSDGQIRMVETLINGNMGGVYV